MQPKKKHTEDVIKRKKNESQGSHCEQSTFLTQNKWLFIKWAAC